MKLQISQKCGAKTTSRFRRIIVTSLTSDADDAGQEEAKRKRSKMATGPEHGLRRLVWQSKFVSPAERVRTCNNRIIQFHFSQKLGYFYNC